MLQAIIFDFDGVIVDSEPLHFRAAQSVLDGLGIPLDYQTYLQECVGQPDLINLQKLCVKHQRSVDEQQVQSLVDAKIRHFRDLLSHARACEGAIQLIKNASQQYPLAICSGSFKNEINHLLTSLDGENLTDYFKHLVSIEDVPAGKPDPAGYRLTASRLQVLPEHCIAIEDSPAGIIAAKTAGMAVLAVTTTHPQEKLSLADHCVSSLAKVSLNDLIEIAHATQSGT